MRPLGMYLIKYTVPRVNFSSGKDQVCPIEDGFGILYELETGEGRASIGETGLILPPYAIVVLGRIG